MAKHTKHSRKLTKAQLHKRYAYERKIGRMLVRKGLLSPRANISKGKPSSSVLKKIRSLEGIYTGSQQEVYLPTVLRNRYIGAGYRVIGKKVIIAKQPDQKIVKRGDELLIVSPTDHAAFETIIFPMTVATIGEFVDWIDEDPWRAQQFLPPGTDFAFTYYGNNSKRIFPLAGPSWVPDTMADWLKHYPQDNEEKWQNMVIVRLIDASKWTAGTMKKKRYTPRSKKQSSNRSAEYRKRTLKDAGSRNAYMKEYYRKLKNGIPTKKPSTH